MKVTKVNDGAIKIAVDREGVFLKAYQCPAKVWTIGIGTTVYPNGKRVKEGDTCTLAQAYEYYRHDISGAAKSVDDLTVDTINENQFSALADFVYNKGVQAYRTSGLRQRVNANPNDPKIALEFAKWKYGGDGTRNGIDDDGDGLIDEPGEKLLLQGLVTRAKMQTALYFKK